MGNHKQKGSCADLFCTDTYDLMSVAFFSVGGESLYKFRNLNQSIIIFHMLQRFIQFDMVILCFFSSYLLNLRKTEPNYVWKNLHRVAILN